MNLAHELIQAGLPVHYIEQGHTRVNGKVVKDPAYVCKPGDRILISSSQALTTLIKVGEVHFTPLLHKRPFRA